MSDENDSQSVTPAVAAGSAPAGAPAVAPGGALAQVGESFATVGRITVDDALICARNVNVHYGDKHAIRNVNVDIARNQVCLLYTSPSPRDRSVSRMPSSA